MSEEQIRDAIAEIEQGDRVLGGVEQLRMVTPFHRNTAAALSSILDIVVRQERRIGELEAEVQQLRKDRMS